MITKGIAVKATEQKEAKNNTPYLDVTAIVDGGEKHYSIFDQKLWDLFFEGALVLITLEKQGNFWNVTKAEATKQLPQEEAEIAPQREGMWWKEIGELIRTNKLEEIFGEKDAPFIKRAYKLQAITSLGITAKKEE